MRTSDVRMENLKLILKEMCWVKPGSNLLVLADDYARPISLAREFMDLANAMGADAVLVSTAIATAADPVEMAAAFKLAVEAGRRAFLSGPRAAERMAVASSPLTGWPGRDTCRRGSGRRGRRAAGGGGSSTRWRPPGRRRCWRRTGV